MAAKVGDIVRFLNDVGGGKVTRIKDNMAYVEDEIGFETPVPLRECVVVDAVKAPSSAYDRPVPTAPSKLVEPEKPKPVPLVIEETPTGDLLNVVLAFEPNDIRNLSKSAFTAFLVNDSNYYLSFIYMVKGDEDWTVRYQGVVEPNIQLRLEEFTYEDLPEMSQVAVQIIAFKKDKQFKLKAPVNVEYKLDTTRFYKLHCFTENEYFDNHVIALQLIKDDVAYKSFKVIPTQIKEAMVEKHDTQRPERRQVQRNPKSTKSLVECDLHINALLDNTNGLSHADMLNVQLDKFREVMNANIKKNGTKVVFIHGKGEGVLRKALLDELKKKYPRCLAQDASFKEYGFGATLITLHK